MKCSTCILRLPAINFASSTSTSKEDAPFEKRIDKHELLSNWTPFNLGHTNIFYFYGLWADFTIYLQFTQI